MRVVNRTVDHGDEVGARERTGKRKRDRSSARTGVHKASYRRYLEALGWTFMPTMGIGCSLTKGFPTSSPSGWCTTRLWLLAQGCVILWGCSPSRPSKGVAACACTGAQTLGPSCP